jgi:hypothetical protein
MPLLIIQLLTLSPATDGFTVEEAWDQLSQVPDLQGIRHHEFDSLLN